MLNKKLEKVLKGASAARTDRIKRLDMNLEMSVSHCKKLKKGGLKHF